MECRGWECSSAHLASQLPTPPALQEHWRDWPPSSQAGRSQGKGDCCFQAKTLLHGMVPTEQQPRKEQAEQ